MLKQYKITPNKLALNIIINKLVGIMMHSILSITKYKNDYKNKHLIKPYYDNIVLSYLHVSLISFNFFTATTGERPNFRDEGTKK